MPTHDAPHRQRDRGDPVLAGLRRSWVATLRARDRLVVMEATGRYDAALRAGLGEADIAYARVNPEQARHFARATGRRARTDAIDARLSRADATSSSRSISRRAPAVPRSATRTSPPASNVTSPGSTTPSPHSIAPSVTPCAPAPQSRKTKTCSARRPASARSPPRSSSPRSLRSLSNDAAHRRNLGLLRPNSAASPRRLPPRSPALRPSSTTAGPSAATLRARR
ncbi:IS110 family transposase [Sphingomonas sp.]|uniref:IS110 family transposase n=1 Tax=Sphingomonas sp. TaxID=28214 RepID=UPI0039C8FC8E